MAMTAPVLPADTRPLGLAVANQSGGDANAGIPLIAQGFGRVVFHGDHLTGVHHANGQVLPVVVLAKLLAHSVFPAYEDDVNVLRSGGSNRAKHLWDWGCIPTHGVDGDGDHGNEGAPATDESEENYSWTTSITSRPL
jgi:hypothetical protein